DVATGPAPVDASADQLPRDHVDAGPATPIGDGIVSAAMPQPVSADPVATDADAGIGAVAHAAPVAPEAAAASAPQTASTDPVIADTHVHVDPVAHVEPPAPEAADAAATAPHPPADVAPGLF